MFFFGRAYVVALEVERGRARRRLRARTLYPLTAETLARRIAYGGRKGAKAAKRLRAWDRCYETDRAALRRFYGIGP
jgi:hypothetical protein